MQQGIKLQIHSEGARATDPGAGRPTGQFCIYLSLKDLFFKRITEREDIRELSHLLVHSQMAAALQQLSKLGLC